jgi:fatty acid desaturase
VDRKPNRRTRYRVVELWLLVGFVGLLCIWRRGEFMTAAVIVAAILLWGDAIGHVMQWVSHDNTDPDNIWSIPSAFSNRSCRSSC